MFSGRTKLYDNEWYMHRLRDMQEIPEHLRSGLRIRKLHVLRLKNRTARRLGVTEKHRRILSDVDEVEEDAYVEILMSRENRQRSHKCCTIL